MFDMCNFKVHFVEIDLIQGVPRLKNLSTQGDPKITLNSNNLFLDGTPYILNICLPNKHLKHIV